VRRKWDVGSAGRKSIYVGIAITATIIAVALLTILMLMNSG